MPLLSIGRLAKKREVDAKWQNNFSEIYWISCGSAGLISAKGDVKNLVGRQLRVSASIGVAIYRLPRRLNVTPWRRWRSGRRRWLKLEDEGRQILQLLPFPE